MEQISSIATNKQPNTYKITFRKIARAAAAEVRVHKKLAIISYVLYGVALLLFIFNSEFYTYNHGFNVDYQPSGWGIVFAIVGVLITFFAVLNVFRDTGNQQLCDVGMALPIKASERFLSKLLCLVYIQIAPFTVSVLVGNWIPCLIGSIQHGSFDDDITKLVFSMFFAGLGVILFIIAITTLCACCCGALAESAYFTFIIMFIINVLPLAVIANIINSSAGFMSAWYWLFDDSVSLIDIRYWGFLFLFTDYMSNMIPHALVSCGISIIVTLLSGLIYKKRDARSVGTPISSKLFFEIMMAGACATIFSLTFMSSAVGWGLLIAGVAYLIISIIVSRAKINALSFLKWIGKFALTAAVFTGLVTASVKTGGFGFYRLRPEAIYLEGASFSITCAPHNGYYSPDTVWLESREPLTSEQADEVVKIFKKHIRKGMAEVNVFSVINDVYGAPWTELRGSGAVLFGDSRSPRFMFYETRDYDTGARGYRLNYSQRVYISYNETLALAEELKQLDYMYEKDHSDYGYYTNTSVY